METWVGVEIESYFSRCTKIFRFRSELFCFQFDENVFWNWFFFFFFSIKPKMPSPEIIHQCQTHIDAVHASILFMIHVHFGLGWIKLTFCFVRSRAVMMMIVLKCNWHSSDLAIAKNRKRLHTNPLIWQTFVAREPRGKTLQAKNLSSPIRQKRWKIMFWFNEAEKSVKLLSGMETFSFSTQKWLVSLTFYMFKIVWFETCEKHFSFFLFNAFSTFWHLYMTTNTWKTNFNFRHRMMLVQ